MEQTIEVTLANNKGPRLYIKELIKTQSKYMLPPQRVGKRGLTSKCFRKSGPRRVYF